MCLTHSNRGQPDKMFTDPGMIKKKRTLCCITILVSYVVCTLRRMNVWRIVNVIAGCMFYSAEHSLKGEGVMFIVVKDGQGR